MGKSLSLNIRERVVALVDDGLKARAFDALFQSVAQTCDLFPPNECRNLFKAAGYVAD